MRSLGSIISILVVAVIGLLVYKFYFTQSSSTGAATPAQTINVVGVKNDLLSIAQAERNYQAEHNSIASLDELVSSGEMSIKKIRARRIHVRRRIFRRWLSRNRPMLGHRRRLHELRRGSKHGSAGRTLSASGRGCRDWKPRCSVLE